MPRQIFSVAARYPLGQDLDRLSEITLQPIVLRALLCYFQLKKTKLLFTRRDIIVHSKSRRAWPRRVLEDIRRVKTAVFHRTDGFAKVALRLARESDDDIGGQCNITSRSPQLIDLSEITFD